MPSTDTQPAGSIEHQPREGLPAKIDSGVRVIRFGRTINSRDRYSVIFGDFDGWIYGKCAVKALRCHRLFLNSHNRRKRSKWSNAVERILRQAKRLRPNVKVQGTAD